MELRSDKTANQLYREQKKQGLTQLDFKTWLQVQKAKNFSNITGSGAVPVNDTLNSSVQDVLTAAYQEGGLQTQAGSTYILGINKTYLIWAGIGLATLVTGLVIYKIVHK